MNINDYQYFWEVSDSIASSCGDVHHNYVRFKITIDLINKLVSY